MLCFVLTLCNLNPYALPRCRKIFVSSWERDGPSPRAPLRAAALMGSRGRPDSTENGVSWLPSELGLFISYRVNDLCASKPFHVSRASF